MFWLSVRKGQKSKIKAATFVSDDPTGFVYALSALISDYTLKIKINPRSDEAMGSDNFSRSSIRCIQRLFNFLFVALCIILFMLLAMLLLLSLLFISFPGKTKIYYQRFFTNTREHPPKGSAKTMMVILPWTFVHVPSSHHHPMFIHFHMCWFNVIK